MNDPKFQEINASSQFVANENKSSSTKITGNENEESFPITLQTMNERVLKGAMMISTENSENFNHWIDFNDITYAQKVVTTLYNNALCAAYLNNGSISVLTATRDSELPSIVNLVRPLATVTVISLTTTKSNMFLAYYDSTQKSIYIEESVDGINWSNSQILLENSLVDSFTICGKENYIYLITNQNGITVLKYLYQGKSFIPISEKLFSTSDGVVNINSLSSTYFNSDILVAFTDSTNRVRIMQYPDDGKPTKFYALRTDKNSTQQWFTIPGGLSLSSDNDHLYLAFSGAGGVMVASAKIMERGSSWSNASLIPNTGNTTGVSIISWPKDLSLPSPNPQERYIYLLKINTDTPASLLSFSTFHLLPLNQDQINNLLEKNFDSTIVTISGFDDRFFIPLNDKIFKYICNNYENLVNNEKTNKNTLNNRKLIPNSFSSSQFMFQMKSLVNKYSYGNYNNYISYDGNIDNTYDYRWTSLSGFCGLIYAKNKQLGSETNERDYKCFNFTVDYNIKNIICFDSSTGESIILSNDHSNLIGDYIPFFIRV